MIKKSYKIISENGLHARPTTMLVNSIVKYSSDAYIIHNHKKVELRSIMGVMSLGVYKGDNITFEITGEDEQQCMDKISETISSLLLGKEI